MDFHQHFRRISCSLKGEDGLETMKNDDNDNVDDDDDVDKNGDDGNETECEETLNDEKQKAGPAADDQRPPDQDQQQQQPDQNDVPEDQNDADGAAPENEANLTSATVSDDFVVVTKSDVEPSKEGAAELSSRQQPNDGYTW